MKAMTENLYTPAFDVYSFAILIAGIFNQAPPMQGLSTKDIYNQVSKVVMQVMIVENGQSPNLIDFVHQVLHEAYRPDVPLNLTSAAQELVEEMWHDDPKKRPTVLAVLDQLPNFVQNSS